MDILSEAEIASYSAMLAHKDPSARISWGMETFGGGLTLLCGLGRGSGVLIDMVSRLGFTIRTIFIDTLALHPESYELIKQYEERYKIRIEPQKPTKEGLAMLPGQPSLDLFVGHDDVRILCCDVRKSWPLRRGMKGYPALLGGLRPNPMTDDRITIPVLEIDRAHGGFVKINALNEWSDKAIREYVGFYKVPTHPLFQQGYDSVGCGDPCTAPGKGRDGRFPWLNDRAHAHCNLNITHQQPI